MMSEVQDGWKYCSNRCIYIKMIVLGVYQKINLRSWCLDVPYTLLNHHSTLNVISPRYLPLGKHPWHIYYLDFKYVFIYLYNLGVICMEYICLGVFVLGGQCPGIITYVQGSLYILG